MLDVRLAQAFQPHRGNALYKPQKARLQVGWKGGDFPRDSFVEDIYPPSHGGEYISFLVYMQIRGVHKGSPCGWLFSRLGYI
jgi:hypothetical protein